METHLKVLHIDAASGFYKVERFEIGRFFGPVDLGLHLSVRYNSLNVGTGLLAGSIIPGSNRLFFTGYSPCWDGFFVSSMGGAGLVFDNLGINMFSLRGKAPRPSILYLNRHRQEEVEVEALPIDIAEIWSAGRKGVYSLMDAAYQRFGPRYQEAPRVLAVGPAAHATDIGAIVSVPIRKSGLSFVDTWAGRGGLGSKMLQEHGIATVIYGGTYVDEDFRDRHVANEWFEHRYNKKMAAKDLDATTKYHFDEKLGTGGTFGVNYTKVGGGLLAFNYSTIFMEEDERQGLHRDLVVDHYLKQFNEELNAEKKSKAMKNCGEPCVAVCKKMRGEYKKDYEPYQAMGPLCGVFDQRAAEKLNHHADALGFDGISIGGVLSWLMECLADGLLTPEELGVTEKPAFDRQGFAVESDSLHNAELGIEMLDNIVAKRGRLDMSGGARALAHAFAEEKGKAVLDRFVYTANGRNGWMVPNQYWTPGVMSPMPIMGKYYMYYGNEFLEPRLLGRTNAVRMIQELTLDNAGMCRFHRGWAEEMLPDIIGTLFDKKDEFQRAVATTAGQIASHNAAIFWESERNIDFVATALERMYNTGQRGEQLSIWLDFFRSDKHEAALNYWFEVRKGIHETLSKTAF